MHWNSGPALLRGGHGRPAEAGLPTDCAGCPARGGGVCGAAGVDGTWQFNQAARRVSLAAREPVFAQGDPARHLFNVVEGVVRLSKDLPDGRHQVLSFGTPGTVLGARGGPTLGHSAVAITPVRVCQVAWSRLERLLDRFPSMERRLREIISADLEAAQDHMLSLGRKTARERMATFLLGLARQEAATAGGPHHAGTVVQLPMSRADIAAHLGLRIETVSRTFTEFFRKGLVRQCGPNRLSVPDMRRLARLADGEA
ncbi:MAG: Crp/Fnr family transcriptional regulator [Acetobacteraceae bacterium]|nr:Crp/Fnr family transcriptional regulator [Acetobacteraceae bacterium]